MTPRILSEIADQVARLGAAPESLPALRQVFPKLHFTHCDDDDVTRARPVWEGQGFNLYLVDGSDHCLQLTSQWERATGILVATVEGAE